MNFPDIIAKITEMSQRLDRLVSRESMLDLAYSRSTRTTSANVVDIDNNVQALPGATKTHGRTAKVFTTETAIPHHLGHTPTFVGLSPRANATVWQSKEADEFFIYLQASVDVDVNWTAEV